VDAPFVDNKRRGRIPSSADTLDDVKLRLTFLLALQRIQVLARLGEVNSRAMTDEDMAERERDQEAWLIETAKHIKEANPGVTVDVKIMEEEEEE
jgi:hypothetical protein